MRCEVKAMELRKKRSNFVRFLPFLILLVFSVTAPFYFTTRYMLNVFVMVFVNVVAGVSLRTIMLSGNMNFAHAAFLGLGAYTAGILSKTLGLPIYITIPAGAVMAMVVGIVTGFPFVRLKGLYYVMASMFFGVFLVYVFQGGGDLTGGANGLKQISSLLTALQPLAKTLGLKPIVLGYYFFFILCVASCLFLYRFEVSRIGWTLRAISQSTDVASSIGINERFFKLMAVGVGCFFVGLSGAAYAHYNTTISPNSYGMSATLWIIMYIMIGGQEHFIGPIIGAIVLTILPEYFRGLSSYSPYVTAAALLIVVYCMAGGVTSLPALIKKGLNQRKSKAMTVAGESRGGGNDVA